MRIQIKTRVAPPSSAYLCSQKSKSQKVMTVVSLIVVYYLCSPFAAHDAGLGKFHSFFLGRSHLSFKLESTQKEATGIFWRVLAFQQRLAHRTLPPSVFLLFFLLRCVTTAAETCEWKWAREPLAASICQPAPYSGIRKICASFINAFVSWTGSWFWWTWLCRDRCAMYRGYKFWASAIKQGKNGSITWLGQNYVYQ